QVDVVDALADRREAAVRHSGSCQQRLEGAAVTLVGEVPSDDVETQLPGARRLFRVDEPEPRLRIDEPADQPGGGDAVDMDPPSRRPGPTGEMAGPSSLGGAPSARPFATTQPLLSSLPSVSAAEADSDDFLEPPARPPAARPK